MRLKLKFEVNRKDRHLDPELFRINEVLDFGNSQQTIYSVNGTCLRTLEEIGEYIISRSYGFKRGAVNLSRNIREHSVLKSNPQGKHYLAVIRGLT